MPFSSIWSNPRCLLWFSSIRRLECSITNISRSCGLHFSMKSIERFSLAKRRCDMAQGQVAQVVLTVDVAIFRQMSSGLEVLLIQRGKPPYQGQWALPGGKLDAQDPTLEYAACREVREEVGLTLESLSQVGTFGNVNR